MVSSNWSGFVSFFTYFYFSFPKEIGYFAQEFRYMIMSSKAQKFYPYAIIFIIASLLFIPFLGSVHLFDWDEINFAESAREMIVTGDYNTVRIDFEPFWEKPPLFIWMQALSMKIFGINEFAAVFRMPFAESSP